MTRNGGYDLKFGGDVVLKFNDLSIWTPEERSWWRGNTTKPSISILRNVSGEIKCGDFVAVMGPSGAGKTSFLVSLAGKCKLPNQGTVVLDTVNVTDIEQGIMEVVPQYEVFIESLSVLEHLNFMIEIKLCNSLKTTKKVTLNNLLTEMNMKSLAYQTISTLSGGERRLLSLATSLLSNPKIIICDEPTTGLDSYNAARIVDVLKRLATAGNIVICSIHQPSSDLFNEFNSIILMAEGRLLFQGNQDNCRELFESVNLVCPKRYNPAEFYIKAISTNPNSNVSYVEKILMAFKNQPNRTSECENFFSVDQSRHMPYKISRRNWFIQIWLLVWRSSLTLKRNKLRHLFELTIGVVLSAVVIGFCYLGVNGKTQQGIQDVRGLLWLLVSEVSFSVAYTSLIAFEYDLTLFKREAGMYSSSAFYISRLICLLPKSVIWSISQVILVTMFVTLPNHFVTSLEFTVTLMATGIASASYGLSLGALFTSSRLTTEVMPFLDLLLILVSGTFLRLSSIPVWFQGFKYISHLYYGMDAANNIYWRQIWTIDCSWNTTDVCVKDGAAVLAEAGYSRYFYMEDSLGFIFIIFGWCLIGYFGLRREEKKGYAY